MVAGLSRRCDLLRSQRGELARGRVGVCVLADRQATWRAPGPAASGCLLGRRRRRVRNAAERACRVRACPAGLDADHAGVDRLGHGTVPYRIPAAQPGGWCLMVPTVTVNALTVVHSKSDGIAAQGPPDVCLTPSPGGPVPVPYPNVAMSKDLILGTKTVTVDGVPMAISDSEFAVSTGDEGGTAGGGVVSGVIKGKAKFVNYSFDVKAEG